MSLFDRIISYAVEIPNYETKTLWCLNNLIQRPSNYTLKTYLQLEFQVLSHTLKEKKANSKGSWIQIESLHTQQLGKN